MTHLRFRQPRLSVLAMTLIMAGMVFGLTGCSGLLHSNVQPEQTYFLRALPPVALAEAGNVLAAPRTPIDASVRVSHPSVAPGLNTQHIVLVQSDRRMNIYTASRWPAPLPDVIEALAVETLRSSGAWRSVEDSTSPFPSDYLLQTVVRRFEADYSKGDDAPPEVHVVLDCALGHREGRDIIASFIAEGTATATANKMSAVVGAFEQATNTALASLSARALEAATRSAPQARK